MRKVLLPEMVMYFAPNPMTLTLFKRISPRVRTIGVPDNAGEKSTTFETGETVASATAALKLQSASQTPSFVSAVLLTVKAARMPFTLKVNTTAARKIKERNLLSI